MKAEQQDLGNKVRALFESRRLPSVTADGFKAPRSGGRLHHRPRLQSGKKSMNEGLQTDAGVPLQCDEGRDFKTFRVGLFGLEKWHNVDKTVASLAGVLDRIGVMEQVSEAVVE